MSQTHNKNVARKSTLENIKQYNVNGSQENCHNHNDDNKQQERSKLYTNALLTRVKAK